MRFERMLGESVLEMARRGLAGATPEARTQVLACVEQIKGVVDANGAAGVLALVLVAAERIQA